ncbi:hypothetical protein ACFOG5_02505 [Pedobacter fastidiosus]|uniref:Uncharacterized protein n=1 Tax=Pedobacter fastidiosus TaxID=2765361 RepID=A0ABR7KWG0_9SPHI|nr:hypothetical protein [Pedobacter fastidiosus]MBC6112443.1 hypothetical protein [Pedobacter fastidiosus]
MPTSRNRKKKKTVRKIKLPSLEKLKEEMRAKGYAPDPIKMRYFEAEFDGHGDSTYQERLEGLRAVGKKANEEFPEKYSNIQKWFERYDQPQLLSFSFYYFMVSPAGYDEEAVKGSLEFPPYYQELLQAFALALPRSCQGRPMSEEAEQFKKDLKEIGELNKLKHFNFPASVVSAEELPSHLLRTEMMMHTTAVRNWSYDHKMKAVTLALAERLSANFISVNGFHPVLFLKLIYRMTEEVEERINEHRLKTMEIMRHKQYDKLIDCYEANFPIKHSNVEERKKLWVDKPLQIDPSSPI